MPSDLPDGLHAVQRDGPDDDSPLVVLVHGVLDSSASFAAVIDRLPEYHVLTYDRRGYGRSDFASEGPTSLAGHADDLLALLGERRATVVGHSMGGNVAMVAADRRPDLVVATAGYEVHAPWLDCWPKEVQDNVMAIAGSDPLQVGEDSFKRTFGEDSWDALADGDRRRRREEGRAYQSDLATGWETQFAFEDPKVPCVLGCGERSVAFFVDATRQLAADLGATYVEIARARHGAHITHPDEFASFVRTTVDAGTRG